MSKVKKKRVKKHNTKSIDIRFKDRKLHEMWVAGGHCQVNTVTGYYGHLSDIEHAMSFKNQWSAIIFAFCENDFEYYAKCEYWDDEKYLTHTEAADAVEKEIEILCSKQNQKHLISPGYVIVPCIDTNLWEKRSEFVDKFQRWGAFDNLICNIVCQIRKDQGIFHERTSA